MPSEELTTFTWGHFGVVPAQPQPGAYKNGALDWVGAGLVQIAGFSVVGALLALLLRPATFSTTAPAGSEAP